jgi:hypothetical protein
MSSASELRLEDIPVQTPPQPVGAVVCVSASEFKMVAYNPTILSLGGIAKHLFQVAKLLETQTLRDIDVETAQRFIAEMELAESMAEEVRNNLWAFDRIPIEYLIFLCVPHIPFRRCNILKLSQTRFLKPVPSTTLSR